MVDVPILPARNDLFPVTGPRTHANCKDQHGVMRPGKIAIDKMRGTRRFDPNKRVWDARESAL